MDNANFLSFASFGFSGVHGEYGPPEHYEKEEPIVLNGKEDLRPDAVQDLQIVDDLPLEFSFYRVNQKTNSFEDDQQRHHQNEQQKSKSDDMVVDEFDTLRPAKPVSDQQENTDSNHRSIIICGGPNRSAPPPPGSEIAQSIKQMQKIPSLSSLGLLRDYANFGFKKLKGDKRLSNISTRRSYSSRKKSSTEEIMRIAGSMYIHFSQLFTYDDHFSMPRHPFGYALSGLSEEETEDVELAHLLLAAAEKVGRQQYATASILLERCEWSASPRANPVQRVVLCFAEALRERIEKETGIATFNKEQKEDMCRGLTKMVTNLPIVKCHEAIPFYQVMRFAGIQSILEDVESETKVHVIDLQIRSGVQWAVLMEALAKRVECRVGLLKITAVGETGNERIEEAGNRLISLAESLNLPFSFKAVSVSAFDDVREELFEIDHNDDEALIIYCPIILRTMIARPRCLENLLRVIRNLYPSLMVVIEVEANHNSPSFVNRFIEALFFYSAYFDCFQDCVKEEECRSAMEGVFAQGIRDIVAMEGSERVTRNVKMDVWRAFFGRFNMVETKMSDAATYQASLVAKQFGCGGSCNLDRNGKGLLIGWKGTPIESLSLWKFR